MAGMSGVELCAAAKNVIALAAGGADGLRLGDNVVAVDSVGAGMGEVILYATGSSARLTATTKDRPVDAAAV